MVSSGAPVFSNDLLFGEGGHDTLSGGAGDDVLYGGAGNDVENGGAGNDTYVYQSGDGADTVTDTDGVNAIYVGSTRLTGTGEKPSIGMGNTHIWTDGGGAYVYEFDENRKTLTITGSALGGSGNSIKLTDIADLKTLRDRYAIDLALAPKVALTTQSGNVFTAPNFTPSDISDSIAENGSRFLNVAFNQSLKAGDTIKLAIDSASGVALDFIKVVTGDQVLGFDGGSITLTATEGQNAVSLAILEQADVSSAASVTFKATLETTDETGAPVSVDSNLFTLDIRDTSGPAPDAIQTSRTIVGDFGPMDFYDDEGNLYHKRDELGNLITDPDKAGPRDDTLYDSGGNDLIEAGDGNDTVWKVRGGEDVINLGAGDDNLYTTSDAGGRVIANGGDGRDYLGAGSGRDIVVGGADADGIYGSSENDRLFGDTQGNAADFIAQGATQAATGQQGEWFDAENGDDQVFGGAGSDLVAGGDGADLIVTGGGNDYIWGDWNTWSSGRAWLDWSVTERVETDADGGNTYYYDVLNIYGESGGGAGDDVIYAGAGDDVVKGERGNDTVYLEDGNDKAWGHEGDDVILGGAGDDLINGDNGSEFLATSLHGKDFLDGGEGNDRLYGEGAADILYGGAGDDRLIGDGEDENAGDDYLDGEDGNDTLYGAAGSDTLFGGAGDDALYGDSSDTAIDNQGDDYLDGEDGHDTILGSGGHDTVFGGDGNDFLQGDSGTGIGDGDDYLNGEAGDDTLVGEGGDDYLLGGDGADTLVGNGGVDTLYGEAGNDILVGDNGGTDASGDADYLDGGIGDDQLFGKGGDDVLIGDAGNDQLAGGDGNDSVDGGADNDTLFGEAGNDTLAGGDGNDYLIGGRGDDVLDGGDGDDVYYYALGDGNDRITDSGGTDWVVLTGIGWDQLVLGVGSLKLTMPDGSAVHLDDFDPDNPLAGSIEYFQFGDATVMSRQQLIETLGFNIEGTPGDDVLSGTAFGEPIHAYEGDDVVEARGGDDMIDLGAGHDYADGGDGNDQILAGEGDDFILGGAGSDLLDGGAGHDVLDGGAGNDTLLGGEGGDSYLFGTGYGEDVVTDTVGNNAIQLTGGLTESEISFSRQSEDLIVKIAGTTDKLTVQGFFASGAWMVALDDGTVFDQAAVEERLVRNQAPVLAEDNVALAEDGTTSYSGNALVNDYDPEGYALRVTNPGSYTGAYGTLSLASGGAYTYALDNASAAVQSLAAGETATDTFAYTATDDDPAGAASASSRIVVSIAGRNDAPVTAANSVQLSEDGTTLAAGNVLANDRDVDAGTVLRVAAAGTTTTAYGTLDISEDGAYSYALNNGDTAVQSLGRGQQVTDHFAYAVSDGITSVGSALDVLISGANDAPILVTPLSDQTVSTNAAWTWQLPAGAFIDVDQGDALSYGATLADGSALPSWLSFDAATATFSGRVPRDASGSLDIRVTATDHVAATGSTAGSLSASDVFQLTFAGKTTGGGGGSGGGSGGGGNGGGSQGNEGVGNGVDGPPPGHDASFNDGAGTSPGDPGAQGGNGYGDGQNGAPSLIPPPRLAFSDVTPVLRHLPSTPKEHAGARAKGHESTGPRHDRTDPGDATDGAAQRQAIDDAAASVGASTAQPQGNDRSTVKAAGDEAAGAAERWGRARDIPAPLNAGHWESGLDGSAASVASAQNADPAIMFARWLAMDLALSEALSGKKPASWLDELLDGSTSTSDSADGGYLGSKLAFGEDAFSLLAGDRLKVFHGLGNGSQKIA